MLNVTVKLGDDQGDYIGLENMDDALTYFKQQSIDIGNLTRKIMNSNVPNDRWDHMYENSAAGSIFAASIARCKIQGGNPLLTMGFASDEKAMLISSRILNGETILINEVGGYCSLEGILKSEMHEIVSMVKGDMPVKQTVFIQDDTTYINLENDDILEPRTVQYMHGVDSNFSYVLNLHKHDVEALTAIFVEFMAKGGTTVYVFTTGLNVSQMYDYSDAIIASGLKCVEFEFNIDYDQQHKRVVKHLEDGGVSVKIVT